MIIIQTIARVINLLACQNCKQVFSFGSCSYLQQGHSIKFCIGCEITIDHENMMKSMATEYHEQCKAMDSAKTWQQEELDDYHRGQFDAKEWEEITSKATKTPDGDCLNCGETIENREQLTGNRRDSGDTRIVEYCDDECEQDYIPF